MDIGHPQRGINNPRQEGHVGYLLQSLVLRDLPDHSVIRVNDARNQHTGLAIGRHLPPVSIDSFEDTFPVRRHHHLLTVP